jgi:hypothetical protein
VRPRGKSVSGISAVLPRGGCRSCWQVESGTFRQPSTVADAPGAGDQPALGRVAR